MTSLRSASEVDRQINTGGESVAYPSVDALQKTLANEVFAYATDRKKAAGRALGTLVEIVTYYTLRAWELRDHIVIERALPEFANPGITHNVEFSLHPVLWSEDIEIAGVTLPITTNKLRRMIPRLGDEHSTAILRSGQLLSKDGVGRNSCVIVEGARGPVVANLVSHTKTNTTIRLCQLHHHPFAIFECKRVGVEEGMSKGPQTIEKAKQGAYVARAVSSLQKVRLQSGDVVGVVERGNGTLYTKLYSELLNEIVAGSAADMLKDFIMTVGVVSNHGNWFTSKNPNKEMRVLAHSYDWLLFLTDRGLAQFIERLLLRPSKALAPARAAFLASYSGKKGRTRFTKVQMDLAADTALRRYFSDHEDEVEGWFNVIAPTSAKISRLRKELKALHQKDWTRVITR